MALGARHGVAELRSFACQLRNSVPGTDALAVGALLKYRERFKGKTLVAVVCGRNIDLEVFKRIIG
jgi:threonine dehydratase